MKKIVIITIIGIVILYIGGYAWYTRIGYFIDASTDLPWPGHKIYTVDNEKSSRLRSVSHCLFYPLLYMEARLFGRYYVNDIEAFFNPRKERDVFVY